MKEKKIISNFEQEFIDIQYELQKKIDVSNCIDISLVRTVAGVDLAYWKKGDIEYAVCCIVVLDYNTHELIEKKYSVDKIDIPYIPGCLAFREIPIFINTYYRLNNDPDVIFFDGNGYLHPRHMGLATHAGVLLNKSTVGVAKSYYKINNVEFEMPAYEENSYTNIEIGKEIYGRALRTQSGVKPIFLSIGNKIDLETAMTLTISLTNKESHIPLPTRLADIMTHALREQYIKVL